MQLPGDFSQKKAQTGGGDKYPDAKGYLFIVKRVEEKEIWKKPCISFEVDIAEGEYKGFFGKLQAKNAKILPLAKVQELTVSDKFGDGFAKMKGIFHTIIGQNLSLFPEVQAIKTITDGAESVTYDYNALYATGNFDEQRLVNLKTGGVLNYNKKGFLNLSYFCSPESAAEAATIPKPAFTKKATGGFGGGFTAPTTPAGMPVDEDLPF